jgi:hypothetical protein
MLTLLFSVCMYRFAELEKRRGWLWGLLTFAISALCQQFLLAGYWGAVTGFVASYALMTVAIIRQPVNKGPFLK